MSFATALVATFGTLLIEGIGYLGAFLTGSKTSDEQNTWVLIIFACIVAFIWLIFFITIPLSKKIIVTENEIRATRLGKTVWILKKEEILLCIYNELHWWHFLLPLEGINAGALQFKLKNGKISRYYCSFSQKQVNKIKANFGYPFKQIQSIYQQ